MSSRGASGLALLLLTACGKAPASGTWAESFALFTGASSASPAKALPAVDLPRATHATAGRAAGVMVTLEGDRVAVDGAAVDASEDALVARLRGRTDAWMSAHAGTPALVLRLPRATSATIVKRIVRSAALAGYPGVAISVEAPGTEAHLDVDTSAAPRSSGDVPERDLHVVLEAGEKITLLWRQGGQILSSLDIPWAGALDQGLAARVTSEWKTMGSHRDPADRRRDLATLSASDGADLATIVAAYDAIRATTRSFADTTVPVFALAFEIPQPPADDDEPVMPSRPGAPVRMGQISVTGGLPRHLIHRVVRQKYGVFRLCYENGLRRNGKLAGEIVVRFTVGSSGSVSSSSVKSSTLMDEAMHSCVAKAFEDLSFLPPQSGTAEVLYPLLFSPP